MGIQKEIFGTTSEGKEVYLYTLINSHGTVAKVTNYGAVLVGLCTKDREGKTEDIVLGYDNVAQYEENNPGMGAVIGRHANRIRNASFTLNGKAYQIEKNDGNNNLHSGPLGYHRRIWEAQEKDSSMGPSVEFGLLSEAGDQGFPGNLDVSVTYTLTDDNSLILNYHAVSDEDTIVNLTNHAYFNLAGHASGDILSQKVWIDAETFTEADAESIPTGVILPVKGTPMDFNIMKEIGRDISCDYPALNMGHGYDHNWILKTNREEVSLVAKMEDDKTGRGMEVYTDLPGMQFYTGNFLKGTEKGKDGAVYGPRSGACFETQYFPNSINISSFPSVILKAGDEYETTTVFRFYCQKS